MKRLPNLSCILSELFHWSIHKNSPSNKSIRGEIKYVVFFKIPEAYLIGTYQTKHRYHANTTLQKNDEKRIK